MICGIGGLCTYKEQAGRLHHKEAGETLHHKSDEKFAGYSEG